MTTDAPEPQAQDRDDQDQDSPDLAAGQIVADDDSTAAADAVEEPGPDDHEDAEDGGPADG